MLEDIIETMNGLEDEQATRLEVDAEAKRAFTALDEKIDNAGKGIPVRETRCLLSDCYYCEQQVTNAWHIHWHFRRGLT